VGVKLYWWTKAKRAQNVNDYESWISGGVAPTLNAMDNNGEAYATVLILFEPKSLFEENWSESKVKNALRANASKSSHLIIDGTRVNDVRVYEDGIVPTVISRYGTGGGNVPMIFEEQPIAYSVREDAKANNFSATETDTALAVQALQPSPQSHHAQLFIAQVSALDTYNQTVNDKTTQAIRASASDVDHIGAVVAFDTYNQTVSDVSQTIKSHSPNNENIGTVATEAVVRRLTPMECERLQGFPDGWTDGQADSNRYKQMGNAVAVPVVEWIISRMVGNDE
jgi:DNA (cytosine-5)-methyltransferase 1